MATGPEFNIRIEKNGKLKVEISGVQGEECIQLAELLKSIIGKEELREMTSEYYGPGAEVQIK
ncbi:MAG: DUF2997 domain-containing protein, partial [Planctomycetota bacterium]